MGPVSHFFLHCTHCSEGDAQSEVSSALDQVKEVMDTNGSGVYLPPTDYTKPFRYKCQMSSTWTQVPRFEQITLKHHLYFGT